MVATCFCYYDSLLLLVGWVVSAICALVRFVALLDYEPSSVERLCSWLGAFGRIASSPPAEYNSARHAACGAFYTATETVAPPGRAPRPSSHEPPWLMGVYCQVGQEQKRLRSP